MHREVGLHRRLELVEPRGRFEPAEGAAERGFRARRAAAGLGGRAAAHGERGSRERRVFAFEQWGAERLDGRGIVLREQVEREPLGGRERVVRGLQGLRELVGLREREGARCEHTPSELCVWPVREGARKLERFGLRRGIARQEGGPKPEGRIAEAGDRADLGERGRGSRAIMGGERPARDGERRRCALARRRADSSAELPAVVERFSELRARERLGQARGRCLGARPEGRADAREMGARVRGIGLSQQLEALVRSGVVSEAEPLYLGVQVRGMGARVGRRGGAQLELERARDHLPIRPAAASQRSCRPAIPERAAVLASCAAVRARSRFPASAQSSLATTSASRAGLRVPDAPCFAFDPFRAQRPLFRVTRSRQRRLTAWDLARTN